MQGHSSSLILRLKLTGKRDKEHINQSQSRITKPETHRTHGLQINNRTTDNDNERTGIYSQWLIADDKQVSWAWGGQSWSEHRCADCQVTRSQCRMNEGTFFWQKMFSDFDYCSAGECINTTNQICVGGSGGVYRGIRELWMQIKRNLLFKWINAKQVNIYMSTFFLPLSCLLLFV